MKTLLTTLALAGLLAAGCTTVTTTTPDGGTNTVRVPDVKQMQLVAKSAAFLTTEIWLYGLGDKSNVPAHPEDRPKFEKARASLQALIAAGTFSVGDLKAALQALPVSEMQGDAGRLVIGEAVVLWDTYGRQLATLDQAQVFNGYVLPVAQALLDGLNLALGQ